jgi:hypothetical protein
VSEKYQGVHQGQLFDGPVLGCSQMWAASISSAIPRTDKKYRRARQTLTNKFGPLMGLRRSSGRCHFSPVGRSFFKAPLGKQKTGDNPENTLLDLRYLQSNERIKVPACDVNHR